MEQFCYLNGKIVGVKDAKVGVYDLGLLRGFGIYEGLITHNRKPFALKDHLRRFHRSAKKLQLQVPVSDAKIENALIKLIALNVPKNDEGLIRIILTGGRAIDGIAHDPKKPTLYMLVEKFYPVPMKYIREGCAVSTVEHERQFPDLKTINYIQAVLLQKTKHIKKVLEVLYVSRGRVLEATGSNFFIVKKGVIVTPKEGILHGITRKLVLELARDKFKTVERELSIKEMMSADEAFITGSFKEVVPVISVDGKRISNGKPGPVTGELIRAFEDLARRH
jgi:branched-chain amino acid aminotransferase